MEHLHDEGVRAVGIFPQFFPMETEGVRAAAREIRQFEVHIVAALPARRDCHGGTDDFLGCIGLYAGHEHLLHRRNRRTRAAHLIGRHHAQHGVGGQPRLKARNDGEPLTVVAQERDGAPAAVGLHIEQVLTIGWRDFFVVLAPNGQKEHTYYYIYVPLHRRAAS